MKAVSTASQLKKIRKTLRERAEVGASNGASSAVFDNISREVLWELVISYCNGKEVGVPQEESLPAVARQFGGDYLYFSDLDRLAFLLLAITDGLRLDSETREPTDQQTETIRKAALELRKSQRKFRVAVTWLCSPKDLKPAVSPNRLTRLLDSRKLEWGRYPHIDKSNEDFIRYFENHGLKHFRIHPSLQEGRLILNPRCIHFVDLFSAFLLDECSGKTLSEMPLKLCRLCKNFFFSQQSKAAFCSRDCQWSHYWTPERRADDKWIRDLAKFSDECKPEYGRPVADLQKKLASPKVMQRLKSIKGKIKKEDWAGWTTIARRIEEIEILAARPGLHR
jgi:hypothetical protein